MNVLNNKIFDHNRLLTEYKKSHSLSDTFDIDTFNSFITEYESEALSFENETGVPAKYYGNAVNLCFFQNASPSLHGYTKVKNIYIYINDDIEAVFKKNKKIIATTKLRKFWLLTQLQKIKIPHKFIIDQDIPSGLYLNDGFDVKKIKSCYVRYYKDTLYDIVFKFHGEYHFFYNIEQVDEYSFFKGCGLGENDVQKIRRMLKLNKIFLKNEKVLDE